MEKLEMICFQIISNVGTARSHYINAIHEAKKGNFEEAYKLIEKGTDIFTEGHKVHAQLIQEEAGGNDIQINLLLIHAEDQLMAADSFKILAKEFIELYKEMKSE